VIAALRSNSRPGSHETVQISQRSSGATTALTPTLVAEINPDTLIYREPHVRRSPDE